MTSKTAHTIRSMNGITLIIVVMMVLCISTGFVQDVSVPSEYLESIARPVAKTPYFDFLLEQAQEFQINGSIFALEVYADLVFDVGARGPNEATTIAGVNLDESINLKEYLGEVLDVDTKSTWVVVALLSSFKFEPRLSNAVDRLMYSYSDQLLVSVTDVEFKSTTTFAVDSDHVAVLYDFNAAALGYDSLADLFEDRGDTILEAVSSVNLAQGSLFFDGYNHVLVQNPDGWNCAQVQELQAEYREEVEAFRDLVEYGIGQEGELVGVEIQSQSESPFSLDCATSENGNQADVISQLENEDNHSTDNSYSNEDGSNVVSNIIGIGTGGDIDQGDPFSSQSFGSPLLPFHCEQYCNPRACEGCCDTWHAGLATSLAAAQGYCHIVADGNLFGQLACLIAGGAAQGGLAASSNLCKTNCNIPIFGSRCIG